MGKHLKNTLSSSHSKVCHKMTVKKVRFSPGTKLAKGALLTALSPPRTKEILSELRSIRDEEDYEETQCAYLECDALVFHSQYCCRSCMYSDM